MRARSLAGFGSVAVYATVVSAAALAAGAAAQAPSASGPGVADSASWTVPRTPWGDPDLQGVWPGTDMMGVPQQRPTDVGERGALTDEEFTARREQVRRQEASESEEFVAPRGPGGRGGAGTGAGPGHWGEHGQAQRQTSLVVDPPDGRIPPMTPEGERRTAAIPAGRYYDNDGRGTFGGPEDLSVYDRCITRGVVGSMMPVGYNAGNQIVQAPGWVALRNEMIHETRIIPLDRRPHLSPALRGYMGDSRGRWQGDTLVVDTTNFNGLTGVGANGRAIYTSDALHLVERFSRLDEDTLLYEVTIDDPRTWSRSWTMAFPLKRDPGYGMFEYACHEGNYGLRNVLSASRAAGR